jgi:multicomponent Na+:H+ antiporter subunit A
MELVAAVLSGFVLSALAPTLYRFGRHGAALAFALLPLALTGYFLSLLPLAEAGQPLLVHFEWVPSLNIGLTFYADGLALLFSLLISGIGTLILIYAAGYLKGHQDLGRFFALILMFMGSMLGVVLAGNLLTLFVFWELTSISSFLLIGFGHDREAGRSSALQALLVTAGGGLALLAGLVLLGTATGTYDIPSVLLLGDEVRAHAFYPGILVLVLLGAFTKSAQFPFHFWLPGAMEAPTPVSAYLHSATMVKAGIYLLARLNPVLGGTAGWEVAVTGFGLATMLVGGYLALYQKDLKRLLAYSTVSALGTITAALGLGSTRAIKAALVFLLAHALYKGALFMVAGNVDHETGTRDVDRLGGLRRQMKVSAVIAVMAALALAGLFPLSFIGKEMLLEAVWDNQWARAIVTPAFVLGGALFVAVAIIVALRPFFGPPKETPKVPHEAPWPMLLGPFVLATLGFLFGVPLLPVREWVSRMLVSPAVASVLGIPEPVKLVIWHGVNPALALSFVSIATGAVVYAFWSRLHHFTSRLDARIGWGPERIYQTGVAFLPTAAAGVSRVLQNGSLQSYIAVTVTAMTLLVGYTLFSYGAFRSPQWLEMPLWHELILAALVLLGALAAVLSQSRLGAIAALGVVGYCVALLFVMFGAPDLAMTQFLIETLTVILFVLVFHHLPGFTRRSARSTRVRDAVIALSAGALMTSLVLTAAAMHPTARLGTYFAEQSLPAAHGRNIVNVILVDFRGLDTLGEIVVLAVAGIGVYALLKLRLARSASEDAADRGGEARP